MSRKIEYKRSLPRNLLWLFSRIFSSAPYVAILWILLVLTNAGLEAGALLLLRATVNSLVSGAGIGPASPWLIALCLVFIAGQTISILIPLLREQMRLRAGFALQQDAMKKISELPLEAFDHEQTHNLIHRVVDGADVRGTRLMEDALSLLEYVPVLITSTVILGLISIWLPVVQVCGILFMRFLGSRFGGRERRFEVENTGQRRLADYYAQLLTHRQTASEIRLWSIGETLLERWGKTLGDYMRRHLRISFQNTYQGVLVTILFSLVSAMCLFVVSLSSGQIEAGLAALLLKALANISGGMNSAQYTGIRFMQHAGYGEDFRRLMEIPSTKTSSVSQAPYPRPLREGIILQDVTYRYPRAHTDALRNINLHIHPGEILAIVGENGAGKTTLAHILAGLRSPTAGRVTIDGTDASIIAPDDIRSACSAVFQHPLRYPTTLRDNVVPNIDNNLDAQVQSALTRVGLSEEQFSLEMLLGPEFGGVDMSSGEWQRVALARSLVKEEATLVIFDEPTASLDPLAELELFENFVKLVNGKTALLIAHRLGPTRLANRVAVLEKGNLVEIGTPAELVKKNGKYAQMFDAQSRWYQ